MDISKDGWIPLMIADGTTTYGTVKDVISSRFVSVNYPREDLNGSAIMLLISLYQIYCCPENEKQWRKGLKNPPLLKISGNFNFNNFMQNNVIGNEKKIQHLFFNSPSMDAVKKNLHFFDKNEEIQKICQSCAIAGIHFYQSNANMGGLNYLVSLRGAAPMNSIIVGKTLWETIWYNVIPLDKLPNFGIPKGTLIPWESKYTDFSSKKCHIFHSLLATPRKIKLVSSEESICDICNSKGPVIKSFMEKTPGVRYTIPKNEKEAKNWNPWFLNYSPFEYKGKRGFEAKKCWAPLTIEGLTDILSIKYPYLNSLYNFIANRLDIPASVWLFGYITDQGKSVKGWLNQTIEIPNNILLAKEIIEYARKLYEPFYSKISRSGINKSAFFGQLKEAFYEVTSGQKSIEDWKKIVKATIEQNIQKLTPNWTLENQNPPKKKVKINSLPEKFSTDESKIILSWYFKLMKKPVALKELKFAGSLDEVIHLKETSILGERLKGAIDVDTTAKIAKVLSHIRHSKSKFYINDLTEKRRKRLKTWNDLLNEVNGTSVNVINMAEIIRNWDTFKQTIK